MRVSIVVGVVTAAAVFFSGDRDPPQGVSARRHEG